MTSSILFSFTVLALLHYTLAVDIKQVDVRSIPAGQGNQDFFALSQSLFFNGERKFSSCGPDLPEIERCIKTCNSPGLSERSGCCCIATSDEFIVGLRGGCRFSQRVQNFTSRLIYKSSPVDSRRPFFGPFNCAANRFTGTGGPCTCSIQWEADAKVLEMASPLPTPSVSPSPVLTATPSPVPSTSPVLTPEPSSPVDTSEPPSEETATPSPDELIPVGPSASPPSPSPDSSQDPGDGLLPTDDDADPSPTAEVPETSPDDAEQQASEDDGSVCVDEQYLKERGFGADALVHNEGVMANVLCPFDRTLPCGTHDHKVRFAGRDMSYEYMCARPDVHCKATRMKVNSVYSHLWTEVAHEDVMLTMFDVRYNEIAQKALHTVMRGWRTAKKTVFA